MEDRKITITRSFSLSIAGEKIGRGQYENAKVFSSRSIEIDANTSNKVKKEVSEELIDDVFNEVMNFEAELVATSTQEAQEEIDKNSTPF